MKTLIVALVMLVLPVAAQASPDEGLFIPIRGVAPKIEVKDGEIVHRGKATRLKPTHVTFRQDTEDKHQFWLELHFPTIADPGDFYLFVIGGKQYSGFVVREIEQNSCKWALEFKDPKAGRDLMRKIAKVYELLDTQVEDKT